MLADLYQKGIRRLMIEGGGNINTLFLKENLVDAMRISIAPFFVGDKNAPRFTIPAFLPQNQYNRIKLEKSEVLGDMVVLHYKLNMYN